MTRDPRIARARMLRRDATVEERRVWGMLSPLNRAGPAHFCRQAVIGRFIVDFADLSRRLVIEIDGGQHGGPEDSARDAWLASQGFRVLRFWNSEVRESPDGIFARIVEALDAPHPRPPHKGEGAAYPDAQSKGASLPLVGRKRVGGPRPQSEGAT